MEIIKTTTVKIDSLAQLRKNKGLSQLDLSKLMNLSRTTISYMESGERRLLFTEALTLCDIFEISLEQLKSLQPFLK